MINIVELTDKFPLTNKSIKIGKVYVEIKTYLSAEDFMSAVKLITDSCFMNGEYHPEFKEPTKKFTYLKYFTDINVDEIDTGELYKITQTEWYDKIYLEISTLPVFLDIETVVDESIKYRIDTRKTAFEKLCEDLSALLQIDSSQNLADIKDVLDKLDSVDKQEFVKAVTENVIEKTQKENT